jgi:hypothetical protein
MCSLSSFVRMDDAPVVHRAQHRPGAQVDAVVLDA